MKDTSKINTSITLEHGIRSPRVAVLSDFETQCGEARMKTVEKTGD